MRITMSTSEAPLAVLRPKRSSFLFSRIVPAVIFFGLLALGASVVAAFTGFGLAVVLIWPMYFFLIGWTAYAASVSYKKERYEVFADRVVAHGGGVFSDRQTDLDFRNVTHVKQRLPWVRYRFFDVGDVFIDSAGSAGAAVVFHSVINPDGAYGLIRERLQQNGFSVRGDTLLHEESPSAKGVMVDLAQVGTGLLFSFAFFLLPLGVGIGAGLSDFGGGKGGGLPTFLVWAGAAAIPLLGLAGNVLLLVLRYFDMRRRTYRIFNDMVSYEEGFLTRNNAFIPYENIADADTARNFIDQMFGLADVKISCQGGGSEVLFRRLAHGDGVKIALDRLVADAQAKARQAPARPASVGADGQPVPLAQNDAPTRAQRPAIDDYWVAELQPSPMRAVAGLLPFILLPPMWFAIGAAWMIANVTRYTITPTGAGIRTGILNKQERQYSYDKVTGVFVKSSPIDRMMKTMSIRVASIGSQRPLDINHVPVASVDLPRLLRQLGIEASPALRTVPTRFSAKDWLLGSVGGFIAWAFLAFCVLVVTVIAREPLVILLVGLPVPFVALSFVHRMMWVQKQELTLHADHAELETGIWWKTRTYARYDDLKKAELVRYPGTSTGRVRFFMAGEMITQQNNSQVAIPFTMSALFVEQVDELRAWLDDVIAGVRRPDDTSPRPARSVQLAEKPAIPNTVLPVAIFAVFLLPLWPFIVGATALRVMRTSYRIEDGRVVQESGILYRTHTSILLDRIDTMQQGQGALGKMFKNGGVVIMTAGSSRPDLMVSAIPGYTAFYQALRQRVG